MIVGLLGWHGTRLAFRVAQHDVLNGDAPEAVGTRVVGEVDGVAFRGRVAEIRHPTAAGLEAREPSIVLVSPTGETTIGHVVAEWIDPEDELGPVALRGRVLASRDGTAARLQIDRGGGLTDADLADGVRSVVAGDQTIATRILSWQPTATGIAADVDGLAALQRSGTMVRA